MAWDRGTWWMVTRTEGGGTTGERAKHQTVARKTADLFAVGL